MCSSFFRCDKNEAEKKIVSLYKEVTDKLIQMRMNNNIVIDSVIEKGKIKNHFKHKSNELQLLVKKIKLNNNSKITDFFKSNQ